MENLTRAETEWSLTGLPNLYFLNSDLRLTRLRAGRYGVRILVGTRDFSLQNVQTSTGANPASYSVGTEVLF